MKIKLLWASAAIICGVSISSCQKVDSTYSCDKEVDSWVKNNLAAIEIMTSADWQEIPNIDIQRGVYRAFTAEQRIYLWEDKFLKALQLDWTGQEKAHIMKLLEFVRKNTDLFSGQGEIDDGNTIEIYKWQEYGVEKLGWDRETIYALCFTPEPLSPDKHISVRSDRQAEVKTRSETGGQKTCNCGGFGGSSGASQSCPFPHYTCRSGNCSASSMGCGIFWVEDCWGVCYTA